MSIILLGWWVNKVIRKTSQKNSVVINYIQLSQNRIQKFIDKSVDARGYKNQTTELRKLSNEIEHLVHLYLNFDKDTEMSNRLSGQLVEKFFHMKGYLTNSILESDEEYNEESIELARLESNQLRENVLVVVLRMCELQK